MTFPILGVQIVSWSLLQQKTCWLRSLLVGLLLLLFSQRKGEDPAVWGCQVPVLALSCMSSLLCGLMQKGIFGKDGIRFLLLAVPPPTPEVGGGTEKQGCNSVSKGGLKAVASWLSCQIGLATVHAPPRQGQPWGQGSNETPCSHPCTLPLWQQACIGQIYPMP